MKHSRIAALLVLVLAAMAGVWWWYASGAIHAVNAVVDGKTVTIAAKVGGQVHEAPVKAGDRVAKGQLLFRLDSGDYDAQAADARAFLAKIAATLPPQALIRHPDKTPPPDAKTLAQARAEEAALRKAVEAASDAQAKTSLNLAALQHNPARQKADPAALASARQSNDMARAMLDQAKADYEKASYARASLEAEEHRALAAQIPASLAAQIALYNAQLAQVRQAEEQRAATAVFAPTAGQVLETAVQAGQAIKAGTVAVRLLPETEQSLWIRAEFAPGVAATLFPGQECKITLRRDITLAGRIAQPPASPAQGEKSLAVRIVFDDYTQVPQGLSIGESVAVSVTAKPGSAKSQAATTGNATQK